jgi:hypothetical protein
MENKRAKRLLKEGYKLEHKTYSKYITSMKEESGCWI